MTKRTNLPSPYYHPPNNLKKYREQAGYSFEEVAKKLGVTVSTVRKWERGMSLPTALHFVGLSDVYKATHLQLYPEYVKALNKKVDERVRLLKKLKRKGIL